MGSFGIVVAIFLVLCFFYCLTKRKTVASWIVDLVTFGFAGIFAGAVISFALGNFVVPSESVLVGTRSLEPMIVKGKEVFAVKKGQSYFYFIKSESSDCVPAIDSILMEEGERYIRFGGDMRAVNKYKIKPKGNLKWFFFSSKSKNELVLLSKEDIL